METPTITSVIITNRNDERFEVALRTAQFADEVLVIDNFSGNNWDELKNRYQFRLLSWEKEVRNFSDVRNFALKHVETTWVFFLDSDEAVPIKSADLIRELIKQPIAEGYYLKRQDFFLGKPLRYGETSHLNLLRLSKTKRTKFYRRVHEEARVEGIVKISSAEIFHFPHLSIKDFFTKISLYSELAALDKTTGYWENLFQLLTFPCSKFIHNYFLKMGLLDGWRGLIYALMMSCHSLFVRIYRYQYLASNEK